MQMKLFAFASWVVNWGGLIIFKQAEDNINYVATHGKSVSHHCKS